jgi:16S rRNA (guanine527-N7)-methyltransferase
MDHRLHEVLQGVSRETLERLQIFHDLLLRWQRVKNIVSRTGLDDIWLRHFADSAQIFGEGRGAGDWVDLGSGGGFPGLVIAILLADGNQHIKVNLVDSDHRKCAFLREVSRETHAPAIVHCARIEDVASELSNIGVVTARALAPMKKLISFSMPFLKNGAKGIFLKGRDIERELIDVAKCSMINIELKPSKTNRNGRIVTVTYSDYGHT